MTDLFFKRQAITGAIASIIGDLEIREQGLKGDSQALKVLEKESKQEKKETIRMHIKNLYHIHNFVHEQFELINEKAHKKLP
tara:strand:+ start:250 stop:495 length:246 start_codon:yes stop_codon:yes gene_type:complete